MPNSLKWVPSEISSDSLLILPIPYIRIRERRIFHGIVDAFSARFQRAMMMKSCAFTCLSRATGGVWHDLSRVANLPEDLDAAFFSPDIFYFCLRKVCFRLVLSLRYAPLFAPRPVVAIGRRAATKRAFRSANAPPRDSHPRRFAACSCTGGGRCSLPSGCLPRVCTAPPRLAGNKEDRGGLLVS